MFSTRDAGALIFGTRFSMPARDPWDMQQLSYIVQNQGVLMLN